MKNIVAFLAVAGIGFAKDKLNVSESGVRRVHPIVEDLACHLCAVDTTDTQVCVGYYGNAVAGW